MSRSGHRTRQDGELDRAAETRREGRPVDFEYVRFD